MPADIETQLQELRHSIDLLQDRLASLEADHARLSKRFKKFPLVIPTRKRTKLFLSIASAMGVMTLLISFSPQNIKIGKWEFHSDGLSTEAITAAGSVISLYFTLRFHGKDKEDYQGNDDQNQSNPNRFTD
jgi:hypothetical protein